MEQSPTVGPKIERRSKPRIECSYPAIVQGWDGGGRKVRTNAILTNLSAAGLCLILKSEVEFGRDLFVLFRCSSTGPLGKEKAPLIAVDGNITRTDRSMNGLRTIAVKIRRNRFL